jgi:hypothetical protein
MKSSVFQIDYPRMCYCEDPFGNVIEIYSHSYEQMYGGVLPPLPIQSPG